MIKLGKYNTLKVSRNVDFGAYLDGGAGVGDILLPARYITKPLHPGDDIEVFIYRDNEGRLIATTDHPFAQVGEFAFLQVEDVNSTGAFLDWGLMKQLLVPYSEQKMKLSRGMVVPVYVYVDDATKRIVASAKIEKFLGNVLPAYSRGDKVKALVYAHNDVGYKAIVDNLHYGMIYDNELFGSPLTLGEETEAWVNRIRPDGKLDLLIHGIGDNRHEAIPQNILNVLKNSKDGFLPLNDHSAPQHIYDTFGCSKKDFKRAIGLLYKDRKIKITQDGIELVE